MVVVFHKHNCGPSVRGTSEGNPAGDFYVCDKGELPPPPRSLAIGRHSQPPESAMDDYEGGHLKTKPDNTGRFVERPTFNSRPLKVD
jgi:hypothetical protein